LPNERRVLRTRRHWAILVPNILLTIVILAVLVGVNTLIPAAGGVTAFVHSVLWYSLWVVLVRLALIMADWWDDLLIITDERILNVTGLFASRMKDTPIKKITDRDIRHSIVGNLLGYGTITIESAGHASLQRLRFVPEPLTVFEAIAKLTSKDGLPPPATGEEQTGPVPSIEQTSAEWPAGEESSR
jgi:uncharacterized membrane protein YdbT with pleckstrin-like domain